eukprot:TRINITY_DN5333_c0_g1_i1.p1 TRINITY_DN5333_c0_g1~~TRINITY_DN5333_c0_g1_i1.p1  ORF type:complete len:126 (-),score=21.54 TRINITY_DN5333_c0_g1_i1:86-463(-)
MELLGRNVSKAEAEGCFAHLGGSACAAELDWNKPQQLTALSPPFDVVVGCEIMYLEDHVPVLTALLTKATRPGSIVYLSYGRNRTALDALLKKLSGSFSQHDVAYDEYDPKFRSEDVAAVVLTRM